MVEAPWFTPEELADPSISLPEANPRHDGINNLLKFAFHLRPDLAYSGSDRVLTPDTGIRGLPCITRTGGGVLRVEYVRRVDGGGLGYAVQFGSDLTNAGPGGWAEWRVRRRWTPRASGGLAAGGGRGCAAARFQQSLCAGDGHAVAVTRTPLSNGAVVIRLPREKSWE